MNWLFLLYIVVQMKILRSIFIFYLTMLVLQARSEDKMVFSSPNYTIFQDYVTLDISFRDAEENKVIQIDTTIALKINGENKSLSLENGAIKLKVPLVKNVLRVESLRGELLYIKEVRKLPGFLTILPPLITIVLAIIFQEVVIALLIGVFLGIFLLIGVYDPLNIIRSPLVFASDYLLRVLTDKDKVSVVVFSLLIGGMVSLLIRNGSMKHLISRISEFIKSKTRVLFSVWIMGILVFFDDYANTLIVGNSMRPLSDKYNVSREKLAYIVDSTAAPVASVAFITTWIGAQLGFINSALEQVPINKSAYHVFLQSLPFAFYPLFTLFFIAVLIWKKRDFGPMYRAEMAATQNFHQSLKKTSGRENR
jgi:hypothetical protein